jgi:hypothetical protein
MILERRQARPISWLRCETCQRLHSHVHQDRSGRVGDMGLIDKALTGLGRACASHSIIIPIPANAQWQVRQVQSKVQGYSTTSMSSNKDIHFVPQRGKTSTQVLQLQYPS